MSRLSAATIGQPLKMAAYTHLTFYLSLFALRGFWNFPNTYDFGAGLYERPNLGLNFLPGPGFAPGLAPGFAPVLPCFLPPV